jgi:RimJ/RimL family protein N-acetyltransferase
MNSLTNLDEWLTLKRASSDFADAFVVMRDAFSAGGEDGHPLTEHLTQYSGHIGYHVHPGYRNLGVATWALRTALELVVAKGVNEALLTCAHDNAASIRVIEKCGGVRIADSMRRRYLIPVGNRS